MLAEGHCKLGGISISGVTGNPSHFEGQLDGFWGLKTAAYSEIIRLDRLVDCLALECMVQLCLDCAKPDQRRAGCSDELQSS